MTAGKEVSQMALSTFQGINGPLAKEFKHLVEWVVDKEKPDAIFLSTAMQVGLAPAIKAQADIPIYCSFQGEDTFLDSLIEPWKSQVWELMRKASKHVERYITPSRAFGKLMSEPLGLLEGQVTHIPNGINLDGFQPRENPIQTPTIGFLARLSHLKGLDILVGAFMLLHGRGKVPKETRLQVAGTTLPDDQNSSTNKSTKTPPRRSPRQLLLPPKPHPGGGRSSTSIPSPYSVPTRYPEAFGLYTIEALQPASP